MAECKTCKTTENIVHSGVDALLLGIDGAETGTICYPCANQARKLMAEREIDINKHSCYSCEQDLTLENTTEFGGLDGQNYELSKTYGGGNSDIYPFVKCDDCFNADIDRHIDRMNEA